MWAQFDPAHRGYLTFDGFESSIRFLDAARGGGGGGRSDEWHHLSRAEMRQLWEPLERSDREAPDGSVGIPTLVWFARKALLSQGGSASSSRRRRSLSPAASSGSSSPPHGSGGGGGGGRVMPAVGMYEVVRRARVRAGCESQSVALGYLCVPSSPLLLAPPPLPRAKPALTAHCRRRPAPHRCPCYDHRTERATWWPAESPGRWWKCWRRGCPPSTSRA